MPKSADKILVRGFVVSIALWLSLAPAVSLRAQNNNNSDAKKPADEEVVIDEIVAKVNDEIVTLTDLNRALHQLVLATKQITDPDARRAEYERQKRELLRSLLINKMIAQRAEELGILANIEQDVNVTIQNILQQENMDLDTFKRVLDEQGSSYQEYRTAIRERIVIQTMQRQFVFNRITVLTSEIEEYYQAHLADFTIPSEVELAEILFLKEGKPAAEVRAKADDVLARLKAGESFDQLARDFSDGRTANRGGALGSYKAGTLAPLLENASNDLEAGQFSEVIEADYGLVIIKVLSHRKAAAQPLEEVRDLVVQKLREGQVGQEMEKFITELRQQSFIYVNPKYLSEYDLGKLL